MPAPRERLIRTLSRIQSFGETSLFFVEERPGVGPLAVEERPGAGPLAVEERPGTRPLAAETTFHDAPIERRWREIEAQVKSCPRCRLCESRTNAVFGSGTRHTRLFVIGEGPGEQEDRRGEAFVGRAGELLTKILKAVGFGRDEVFITNIVKCRPPRNRAPFPDEVAACMPYLEAQLDLVRPAVILTLGASATQALLQTPIPISRLRGRVHLYRGVPVVPTYHPAALLRSPQYKRPTWEDVQLMRRIHDERVAELDGGAAAAASAPTAADVAGGAPPPAVAPEGLA